MFTKNRVQIIHFQGKDTNKVINSKVILAVNHLTIFSIPFVQMVRQTKPLHCDKIDPDLTSHQVTMLAQSRKITPAQGKMLRNAPDMDTLTKRCLQKKLDLLRRWRKVNSSS